MLHQLIPSPNALAARRLLAAALAVGLLVALAAPVQAQNAELQVIHNAAGFGDVDIYVLDSGGSQLAKLDDFPFRGALIADVPAGQDLEITVNGSGSQNAGDNQVASVSPINLTQDTFNQAFAVGTDQSNFQLLLEADQSKTAGATDVVDLLVGHQSPDAPAVDVLTRGFIAVDGFTNPNFANGGDYITVPALDYILRVGLDDNSAFAASFQASLAQLGLGGSTLTVLASGFLDPGMNQPGFALIAVAPANSSTTAPADNVIILDAAPQTLIINEFFANPSNNQDTNGDGVDGNDEEEEFIEILNITADQDIDVSGYVIRDAADNVYTFPDGTIIPAGEGATIFRGGTPTNIPGFSDVGSPALNQGGDDIILEDAGGSVLDQITYPTSGGLLSPEADDESTTRDPDGTGPMTLSTTTDNGNNFTPGFQLDGTALPVELAGFRAQLDGRAVTLTWRTLSETNNAGFAVQQRVDEGFQQIGFRSGQGTTSEATDYRFRVGDLAPGTHAFRLKQVDTDGSTSLSNVVEVQVGPQGAFTLSSVAPHPVRSDAALRLAVREAQDVTVALYNALGQRVRTLHQGAMTPGAEHEMTVAVDGLASGVYLLRVEGASFSETRKVTVVR